MFEGMDYVARLLLLEDGLRMSKVIIYNDYTIWRAAGRLPGEPEKHPGQEIKPESLERFQEIPENL